MNTRDCTRAKDHMLVPSVRKAIFGKSSSLSTKDLTSPKGPRLSVSEDIFARSVEHGVRHKMKTTGGPTHV